MSLVNRFEQENDLTDHLASVRPKGLKLRANADTNLKLSTTKTPVAKNMPLKNSGDLSSRKAFGRNVSNVLKNTQLPVGGKPDIKGKASGKSCEKLGVRSSGKQDMDCKIEAKEQAQTEAKVDPKYLDEIENMYPISEELMSDLNEPITFGLYTDDQLVAEMPFEEDSCTASAASNQQDHLDFDKFF